jgi:hypothetical protein
MAEWIKKAENLPKIAQESNLFIKKVATKEIFGSNLILTEKNVRLGGLKNQLNWGQNQWAALAAARAKRGKMSESLIAVQ